MKFLIKQFTKPEAFSGQDPVYFTGDQVFKIEKCERNGERIAEDTFKYITGFTEEDIRRSAQLTDEEKEVYISQLDQAKEALKNAKGEKALDSTNEIFWGKPSRRSFKLDKNVFNTVYDDTNIDALILKQSIIANAFPQIAHKEEAKNKVPGKSFYMVEIDELENKQYNKDHGFKLKAMAKLNDIVENKGKDELLFLSWYLDDDLSKGFTRNSSKRSIESYLIDFIEGKNVKSKKKKCAKEFVDAYNLWDSDKDTFMAKVIFRVGKQYNLIYSMKGKMYIKSNKMELGKDESSSISILLSPKNSEEFASLYEEVNSKLDK